MSDIDRALCRKAATECIELARISTDLTTKQTLLTRAQEWLKLAYAENAVELGRHLDQFNSEQFGTRAAQTIQRQPMQQQRKSTNHPSFQAPGGLGRVFIWASS